MLKTELLEIIANGENSGIEFKYVDVLRSIRTLFIIKILRRSKWQGLIY